LKSAQPDASYIDALIRDFDCELPRVRGRRIETVFFGGGTPSLFPPDEFARLLRALQERIEFAPDAEITMEANPGTIERGRFAGYRDAGITRVSLGAQTFAAASLEALGRIHSADDTHRAVDELRAARLENFNLDLMYALPRQSLEEALDDVRIACALNPAHISFYQLTLEAGTVFAARPPPLPDEDVAWQIQVAGQRLLSESGFAQYEVSAYARTGARCRHNLNYWRFGDYIGVGAGAHGKITMNRPFKILRTNKPKQPREYQLAVDRAGAARAAGTAVIGEARWVDAAQVPFEFMLNALRLNEGFTAQGYRATTGRCITSLARELAAAEARGLLTPLTEGWKPTALGMRFLNDLQESFLA
jgi:oxygen-independent coproporphyrinogen-3 oxidase